VVEHARKRNLHATSHAGANTAVPCCSWRLVFLVPRAVPIVVVFIEIRGNALVPNTFGQLCRLPAGAIL
jgi:hypothetical protein